MKKTNFTTTIAPLFLITVPVCILTTIVYFIYFAVINTLYGGSSSYDKILLYLIIVMILMGYLFILYSASRNNKYIFQDKSHELRFILFHLLTAVLILAVDFTLVGLIFDAARLMGIDSAVNKELKIEAVFVSLCASNFLFMLWVRKKISYRISE